MKLIWLQLYNVPLQLYSRKGLSYISSAIRVPLYVDSATSKKQLLNLRNCGKCKTFGHVDNTYSASVHGPTKVQASNNENSEW
ncbi:hypothetical protein V6N13_133808 [Hibiscus sabdariffa]